MEVSLTLDGGPELERKLAELTAELQREVLLAAMLAAGEPIRQEAASRAPVRKGSGGGTLARSVTVEAGKKQKPSVRVGVGKEGWYGGFVERGTRQRRTKKGADRGRASAQPFLRPALDAKRDEALREFIAVIRARLGLS